jgi:DNA-binding transcriptional MerR regulator
LKDEIIIDLLVKHKGSVPKVAKELGVHERTLRRRIAKSEKIQAEKRKKELKGYKPYSDDLDERLHDYIFHTNGVLEEIVKLLLKDNKNGVDIKNLFTVKALQHYLEQKDKTSLKNDLYNARTRLIKNMSRDDLALLIQDCHGNVSLMAQRLFISYTSMWMRIDRDEYLKELRAAAETKMYTDATHFLHSKLNDPKVDVKIRVDIARMIMLNHRQAKKDGWGSSVDVTSNGKDVNALKSLTVEVVTKTPKSDDGVIDAEISEPKQITD